MDIAQFEKLVRTEVEILTLSMNRNAGVNRQALLRFLAVLNESETDEPEEAARIFAHICALDMIANLTKAYQKQIIKVLDSPSSQEGKEFAEWVFAGKFSDHTAIFQKESDEKN